MTRPWIRTTTGGTGGPCEDVSEWIRPVEVFVHRLMILHESSISSKRAASCTRIYRLLDFSLLDLLVLPLLFSLLVPVLLLLLFDPFTFLSVLSASCRCCFRVGKVWLANFFTSGSLALSDSCWNLLTSSL